MSSSVSAMRAADPPVRREEILPVALLPAFAGGYLDTYTWITHGVLGVGAAFGTGAAAGAFLTERAPTVTLGVPVVALLVVLLLCDTLPAADVSRK